MSIFEQLAAPFATVHWRAQAISKAGTSAQALAYIDARDVMDRFDSVCGPEGWQNDYIETPRGRVIGKISVLIDGQWITKADGAGDTDVEGEKGGISDALKRAAVLWGVGRYLYRLPATWADCEPMRDTDGNVIRDQKGKARFKSWTPAGLKKLQQVAAAVGAVAPTSGPLSDDKWAMLTTLIQQTKTSADALLEYYGVKNINELSDEQYQDVYDRLSERLKQKAA